MLHVRSASPVRCRRSVNSLPGEADEHQAGIEIAHRARDRIGERAILCSHVVQRAMRFDVHDTAAGSRVRSRAVRRSDTASSRTSRRPTRASHGVRSRQVGQRKMRADRNAMRDSAASPSPHRLQIAAMETAGDVRGRDPRASRWRPGPSSTRRTIRPCRNSDRSWSSHRWSRSRIALSRRAVRLRGKIPRLRFRDRDRFGEPHACPGPALRQARQIDGAICAMRGYPPVVGASLISAMGCPSGGSCIVPGTLPSETSSTGARSVSGAPSNR